MINIDEKLIAEAEANLVIMTNYAKDYLGLHRTVLAHPRDRMDLTLFKLDIIRAEMIIGRLRELLTRGTSK